MSKKTQREIPADMWLHVATDALARWSASGAGLQVVATVNDETAAPALMIVLEGVALNDPRLAPAFVAGLIEVAETTPAATA